jgi:hypothetical protein
MEEKEDPYKLVRLGLAKPSNLPRAMLKILIADLGAKTIFDIARAMANSREDNDDGR